MFSKRFVSILLTATALMIGIGILLNMGRPVTVAQTKPSPVTQIAGYTWSGGNMNSVPPPVTTY
jgi:hypothetical protein